MFVFLLVILLIACALVFGYKQRRKLKAQRNTDIDLSTRETNSTPTDKPDGYDESMYQPPPVYTIANSYSLDCGSISNSNKDIRELPPTYEDAVVMYQSTNLSRRE